MSEISEDLSRRKVRPLTDQLVILNRDVSGLYIDYSEEDYTVDIQDSGAWACSDVEPDDLEVDCKHQRIVRFCQ